MQKPEVEFQWRMGCMHVAVTRHAIDGTQRGRLNNATSAQLFL